MDYLLRLVLPSLLQTLNDSSDGVEGVENFLALKPVQQRMTEALLGSASEQFRKYRKEILLTCMHFMY